MKVKIFIVYDFFCELNKYFCVDFHLEISLAWIIFLMLSSANNNNAHSGRDFERNFKLGFGDQQYTSISLVFRVCVYIVEIIQRVGNEWDFNNSYGL